MSEPARARRVPRGDRAASRPRPTRIQREKTEAILAAALDAFSTQGYHGATLDRIAEAAGLSKPNLLYYFASKEAIHRALLERLLDSWLEPLRRLDPDGDPGAEITEYVRRKLRMSRDLPRESRLFAGEVLAGAPRIADQIGGPLRTLVDEKAAVIRGWAEAGRIASVDPYHLIFSIWAATQHYADFDAQVRGILGTGEDAHFDAAERHLTRLFARAVAPEPERGAGAT
ncbi:MAG: TetR family transcriptional regulator [Rhodovulum sulfidophilum]|uniref:TetR family transcriptional regulator n=1 Tax=Rhodovulum sulfidophilum TaxID=35806 RepID=A0A2W5N3Y7_RHOSU|nr:MAG: TetR family transcriptional regulator [Rhodovulum sulfidophilum]